MSASFRLNHDKLAGDPQFAEIRAVLDAIGPIESDETFNHYCREAYRAWRDQFRNPIGETSAQFTDLLEKIERRGQDVIKTAWGGVVVTRHEPPLVEKFLVVREGGYLALEKHDEKDEHLEVIEGAGLILWRRAGEEFLTAEPLRRGLEFHLLPGIEHCIIGAEDLLIFERSTDPKGMDQDLIFIYEPDQT
jgi:hypothetical protein